jgi:hypothetical protein
VRRARVERWQLGILYHHMPESLVLAIISSSKLPEQTLKRRVDELFDPTTTELMGAAATME